MTDELFYRWQVVSESGKLRRRPRLLAWEMTESDAACWQKVNPETLIEKVPGTGCQRIDYSGQPMPPKL